MNEGEAMFEQINGWTVLLGGVALYTWLLERNASMYATFDTMYQNILAVAMQSPEFRDPTMTADYKNKFTGTQLVKYEIYAYMVLNVCETIADSLELYSGPRRPQAWMESRACRFLPFVADHDGLVKTWEPVLLFERNLHQSWLNSCVAGCQFKEKFVN